MVALALSASMSKAIWRDAIAKALSNADAVFLSNGLYLLARSALGVVSFRVATYFAVLSNG